MAYNKKYCIECKYVYTESMPRKVETTALGTVAEKCPRCGSMNIGNLGQEGIY